MIDPPLDVIPDEIVTSDLGRVLDDPKRTLRYLEKHVVAFAALDPLRISATTNLESMLGGNLAQNLVETIVGYHLLGLLKGLVKRPRADTNFTVKIPSSFF